MRRLLLCLVTVAALAMPAAARSQSRQSLADAAQQYAEVTGWAFSGACEAPTSADGACYQATVREDGNAEVSFYPPWGQVLVLFAPTASGWKAFTRPIAFDVDGIAWARGADWADLTKSWLATMHIPQYFDGIVTAWIDADGSGRISSGRFAVASLQFDSFQDGIAVGHLTRFQNPCATEQCTPGSALADDPYMNQPWLAGGAVAVVMLKDGTAVLTATSDAVNIFLHHPF